MCAGSAGPVKKVPGQQAVQRVGHGDHGRAQCPDGAALAVARAHIILPLALITHEIVEAAILPLRLVEEAEVAAGQVAQAQFVQVLLVHHRHLQRQALSSRQ